MLAQKALAHCQYVAVFAVRNKANRINEQNEVEGESSEIVYTRAKPSHSVREYMLT
jgi:hypothetical protein